MEIVEFQGGKYQVISDGLSFKLKPVGYQQAKACSLAQIAAEFKAEREQKAESKILSRIAHKGQEWDIVADSLGLKLVLVEGEKMPKTEPNWSEAPADATHYSESFNWFLKQDPSNPDHWLYWHKKPHHLAKGKWMPDGSHPEALVRRLEQTGAVMQEPNWLEAPPDATHYSKGMGWFLKADPEAHDCWLYWYMSTGNQGSKPRWIQEGIHACNGLIERPEDLNLEPEENCNGCEAVQYPTASEINDQAMKHIRDRASTYDQPQGERSMGKTVRAFNAITGQDLTESEGWLLLQVLKDVRQWQNPNEYHQDSGEDCIAYAALKAESLAGGR